MRHPTALFFWGFVAALVLWAGAAAMVPPSASWSFGHGIAGPDALLVGPGAWGPAHMRGGLRIAPQTGRVLQIGDVERAMTQWLALEGNPRLKLGPVTEKNSDAFQADIVTREGSLVQRFAIDRNSGRVTPVED